MKVAHKFIRTPKCINMCTHNVPDVSAVLLRISVVAVMCIV